MASDPRVAAAIRHWAPRFVAQGVTLTDFEDVTASHEIVGRLVRAPGRRGRPYTRNWDARRSPRRNSSAPASICSAPASTTISASFCSCRTSRR